MKGVKLIMKKKHFSILLCLLMTAAVLSAGTFTATAAEPSGSTGIDLPIDSFDHNLIFVAAKNASCTQNGNKAYYKCSDCGEWFEDPLGTAEIKDKSSVVIAAAGHSWGEWQVQGNKMVRICKNDPTHIESKDITDELKNLSSITSEEVYTGAGISLKGAAEGGTAPYFYAFMYKSAGASSWKVIGTKFGTSDKETFTPTKAGAYEILISVKDSAGKTAAKKFNVSVKDKLVNNSSVSSTELTIGSKLTMTGAAEGGTAPYRYAYLYKAPGAASWKVAGTKFGTSANESINPTKVGIYEIMISVKDSEDKTESKKYSVTVKDNKLVNKSSISGTDVLCGTKLTITGAAEGGEGTYLYTYQIKKPGKTSWTTLGEKYVTTVSKVFTAKESGTYEVRVLVKDGAGTVKAFSNAVKSTSTLLKNKSTISTDTAKVGDKVMLAAVPEGGTAPYRFTYEYKKPGSSSWKTIGKRGAAYKSVSFTAETAGTYEARVYIQDESDYVTVKTFKVTVS